MLRLFKKSDKDSVYSLEVAMKQAQHDIKELEKEIKLIKKSRQVSKCKYVAEDLNTVEIYTDDSA